MDCYDHAIPELVRFPRLRPEGESQRGCALLSGADFRRKGSENVFKGLQFVGPEGL